jgi:hypothetical protein
MAHVAGGGEERDLTHDLKELRAAVGLEDVESTTKNEQSDTSTGPAKASNGAR